MRRSAEAAAEAGVTEGVAEGEEGGGGAPRRQQEVAIPQLTGARLADRRGLAQAVERRDAGLDRRRGPGRNGRSGQAAGRCEAGALAAVGEDRGPPRLVGQGLAPFGCRGAIRCRGGRGLERRHLFVRRRQDRGVGIERLIRQQGRLGVTACRFERNDLPGRFVRRRLLVISLATIPSGEEEDSAAEAQGGQGDDLGPAAAETAGDGRYPPVDRWRQTLAFRKGFRCGVVLRFGGGGHGWAPCATLRSTIGEAVPVPVATPRGS